MSNSQASSSSFAFFIFFLADESDLSLSLLEEDDLDELLRAFLLCLAFGLVTGGWDAATSEEETDVLSGVCDEDPISFLFRVETIYEAGE